MPRRRMYGPKKRKKENLQMALKEKEQRDMTVVCGRYVLSANQHGVCPLKRWLCFPLPLFVFGVERSQELDTRSNSILFQLRSRALKTRKKARQ